MGNWSPNYSYKKSHQCLKPIIFESLILWPGHFQCLLHEISWIFHLASEMFQRCFQLAVWSTESIRITCWEPKIRRTIHSLTKNSWIHISFDNFLYYPSQKYLFFLSRTLNLQQKSMRLLFCMFYRGRRLQQKNTLRSFVDPFSFKAWANWAAIAQLGELSFPI